MRSCPIKGLVRHKLERYFTKKRGSDNIVSSGTSEVKMKLQAHTFILVWTPTEQIISLSEKKMIYTKWACTSYSIRGILKGWHPELDEAGVSLVSW